MGPSVDPEFEPGFRYALTYDSACEKGTLKSAAAFFSTHYGTWSTCPASQPLLPPGAKPGSPIKLTAARMKEELLPPDPETADWLLITATDSDDDEPKGVRLGQVFACKWTWQGQRVLWIAQLVVHTEYRRKGVARDLLKQVNEELIPWGAADLVGVASSNPATIRLVADVLGLGDEAGGTGGLAAALKTEATAQFQQSAAEILEQCPIKYIRGGRLARSTALDATGPARIMALWTGLYVDHAIPDHTLQVIKEKDETMGIWPAEALPEGYEWLLICAAKPPPESYGQDSDEETESQDGDEDDEWEDEEGEDEPEEESRDSKKAEA